jgi:hypothetical protein
VCSYIQNYSQEKNTIKIIDCKLQGTVADSEDVDVFNLVYRDDDHVDRVRLCL